MGLYALQSATETGEGKGIPARGCQGWQSAGKTRSPDPRPTRHYPSRSGSAMRSCFNSRVRPELEADPIKVGSGSIKGYKLPGKCRSGYEMWSGFPGFYM